ncbi:hypothetical protein G3I30_02630 [Actinospica acidiphila]|nr:hypothetical protein [Actinospica acidiphila]
MSEQQQRRPGLTQAVAIELEARRKAAEERRAAAQQQARQAEGGADDAA